MVAQTLRMPRLPMVVIPHPLGGLKPEQVMDKARLAFQGILKLFNRGAT
jgi:hypothetical protein